MAVETSATEGQPSAHSRRGHVDGCRSTWRLLGAHQCRSFRIDAIWAVAFFRDSNKHPKKWDDCGGKPAPFGKTIPAPYHECDEKHIRERRPAVNFSSSAPVRQPEIEPPEKDLPGPSAPPEAPEASADTVAHLRVLWGHRGLLFRAALYGVVASVLV